MGKVFVGAMVYVKGISYESYTLRHYGPVTGLVGTLGYEVVWVFDNFGNIFKSYFAYLIRKISFTYHILTHGVISSPHLLIFIV